MPMASIATPALKTELESDTGVAAAAAAGGAHTGMDGHALQEGSNDMVEVPEGDSEELEVIVGAEEGVGEGEKQVVLYYIRGSSAQNIEECSAPFQHNKKRCDSTC